MRADEFQSIEELMKFLDELYGPGELWQHGKAFTYFSKRVPPTTPYIPPAYRLARMPVTVHFIGNSSFRPSEEAGLEKPRLKKRKRR